MYFQWWTLSYLIQRLHSEHDMVISFVSVFSFRYKILMRKCSEWICFCWFSIVLSHLCFDSLGVMVSGLGASSSTNETEMKMFCLFHNPCSSKFCSAMTLSRRRAHQNWSQTRLSLFHSSSNPFIDRIQLETVFKFSVKCTPRPSTIITKRNFT